ncbi:TPA: hypothetical protein L9K67_004881 [Klebsiella pneumoniae]|nr:hypothetical protein [Klebsiella pneumoniae]
MKYVYMFICLLLFLATSVKAEIQYLGVGTHIKNYNDPDKLLQSITELGVNSIRDDINWDDVEIHKGIFTDEKIKPIVKAVESLNTIGVKPIIILSFTNTNYNQGKPIESANDLEAYSRYVAYIVDLLKGKVLFYEIGNEWTRNANVENVNKNAIQYLSLIEMASKTIRNKDNDARILFGSLNLAAPQGKYFKESELSWLKILLENGVMKFTDGISIHAYSLFDNPGIRDPASYFRYVDLTLSQLHKVFPGDLKIYITETGIYSKEYIFGKSDKFIKDYINSYMNEANKRGYIKGIWWYDLKDDGSDPYNKEHHFGIFDKNFQFKEYTSTFINSLERVK